MKGHDLVGDTAQCLESMAESEDGLPSVAQFDSIHSALLRLNRESSHILVEKRSDCSIEISIRAEISRKGWYMAFRIYDDWHVADNGRYIKSVGGMDEYYAEARQAIEGLGLGPFHNPFSEYIDQRWEEYKKKNRLFPYNLEE